METGEANVDGAASVVKLGLVDWGPVVEVAGPVEVEWVDGW